jgi:hypothetical protein
MSFSDPRFSFDSKLLDKDPVGQDDTRRALAKQDWKFVCLATSGGRRTEVSSGGCHRWRSGCEAF